jgi:exocyst complex component 7
VRHRLLPLTVPGPLVNLSQRISKPADVLCTLISSLDSRARFLRTPTSSSSSAASTRAAGISAIFTLNNITYVRREILSSQISDGLSNESSCEAELNRRNRAAKAAYLEIFSPLVACLMDSGESSGGLSAPSSSGPSGGGTSGLGLAAGAAALKAVAAAAVVGAGSSSGAVAAERERRDVKDRFVRFQEALNEVESLHRAAALDPSEADMRQRLKDEVSRMVCPTYAKFYSRHQKGEFSKSQFVVSVRVLDRNQVGSLLTYMDYLGQILTSIFGSMQTKFKGNWMLYSCRPPFCSLFLFSDRNHGVLL